MRQGVTRPAFGWGVIVTCRAVDYGCSIAWALFQNEWNVGLRRQKNRSEKTPEKDPAFPIAGKTCHPRSGFETISLESIFIHHWNSRCRRGCICFHPSKIIALKIEFGRHS
jgi:hypothetical protein